MDDWQTSIADPAGVMVGLGAICALFAAIQWLRVSSLASTLATPEGWRGRNRLRDAALLTGIAMALAASGYLFGRVTGRF